MTTFTCYRKMEINILDITSTSKYNSHMKKDNTISVIGKIKENANDIIVKELRLRGYDGLVPSHGDILSVLIFEGEMTKKEIAKKINRKQSTITTLLDKLEKFGYVTSEVNANDARSMIVSLTSKGRLMENDVLEISNHLYKVQFMGMSEEEIRDFRKLLNKVYQNFMSIK